MTSAKVAITIPAEVLKLAKEQVKTGRAKSLSALVTQAVDEKLSRNDLLEILNEMDATYGKPKKADQEWAKRVLKRSS
jgi:Arc/MetJ-type ribon-helix-helix transcriptional regulator